MTALDCLLKNTVLEKDLRKWIEKRAYQNASDGRDASLNGIFNELNKHGVEVSLRAVGQMYMDANLPGDGPFTSHPDVDKITGRRFENTLRNLIMMKPKKGEIKMGKEALGEHIAGSLTDAFYNNVVEDNTTKSTMVKLRDTVMAATKRLLGEMPNKDVPATKEQFEDTVCRYMDQENKQGFDTLSGKMNNIHDVMRESVEEFKRYETGLADDPAKLAQFKEYTKNIEDALNSVLFSRKDAGNVIDGALKEAGYTKTLADGREIKDWDKMAGEIHDVRQLRTNVRDAMEKAGYDPATAMRIADSLQKEYHDLRGKTLEYAQRKFDAREANINKPKNQLPRMEVNDMINKRAAEWENYKKLADDDTKKITFGKKEAKDILTAALKQEGYGKELPNGKVVLDWTKLSREVTNSDMLKHKVLDMLLKDGHSLAVATGTADAINNMYTEMRQEIIDHAHEKLTSMQDSIGKERTGAKTDLARLSEMTDLGLFNGGYERLLNDRLGVDGLTQSQMDQLRDIGKKASDLTVELNSKNYLATTMFSSFQRDIEHILAENRTNRSGMLKAVKVIGDIFSVINVGILANPWNLAENNLSGYQAILSKNQEVFKQMGRQGMFGDGKLWRAVLADVSKGGVEYGDASDKLSHTADFSKNLNTLNFVKNPVRALGTAAIFIGRAGLNGIDAANKAVLHKKSMMLGLHKALTQGSGLSTEEATHFLNEALYGESFDQAKVRADDMLKRYGLKNTDASRTRLANDLVIGNLNMEGLLTDVTVEAAMRSGFEVAAIALGHKANNKVSEMIHEGKIKSNNTENNYIKNGEYGKAAMSKLYSNLFYNGLLKFVGGGMNWAVLRVQNLGLGLVTGYAGDYNSSLDFKDKETLERTMTNRLKANRQIASSITEMGAASLAFGLMYAYGFSKDDENEGESVMERGVRHAASDYGVNRLVSKVAPNIIQLYYMSKKNKGEGTAAALKGTFDYMKNIANIGSEYTVQGRIGRISKEADKGNKGYAMAMGDLGAIAGDMITTPFYRSAKNFYQVGNYWATGNPIDNSFKKPMSIWDGMFGGGLLEDAGMYKRSAPIEVMPGMTNKLGLKFRAMGIENVQDLKDHPDWELQIPSKHREGAKRMYADITGDKSLLDSEE